MVVLRLPLVLAMTHKFAIGESVEYRPGRSISAARGVYLVTKKLPGNDSEPEYRVRNPSEPHERTAKESDLKRP
jgi:hypothetical protein